VKTVVVPEPSDRPTIMIDAFGSCSHTITGQGRVTSYVSIKLGLLWANKGRTRTVKEGLAATIRGSSHWVMLPMLDKIRPVKVGWPQLEGLLALRTRSEEECRA
jgi:hypothetical protein